MSANKPKALPALSAKDLKRFRSKFRKGGKKECWIWSGALDFRGYGNFQLSMRSYRANRVAYFVYYEVDPGKLLVCHSCDVPSCVNPHHFFLGTHQDNIADSVKKGRMARGNRSGSRLHPEKMIRGELHHFAKVTEEQVANIRSRYISGIITMAALAKEYGVSQHCIWGIVTRRVWKHI